MDHSTTTFSSYRALMHKQPQCMSRTYRNLPIARELRFFRSCARSTGLRGSVKGRVSERGWRSLLDTRCWDGYQDATVPCLDSHLVIEHTCSVSRIFRPRWPEVLPPNPSRYDLVTDPPRGGCLTCQAGWRQLAQARTSCLGGGCCPRPLSQKLQGTTKPTNEAKFEWMYRGSFCSVVGFVGDLCAKSNARHTNQLQPWQGCRSLGAYRGGWGRSMLVLLVV